MCKQLLSKTMLIGCSYVITLLLLKCVIPVSSQPNNVPAGGAIPLHWHQGEYPIYWGTDLERLDPDYQLILKSVKIRTPLEAKEVAIAYLKERPEFREAVKDLINRIPWNEETFYRTMVIVVNVLTPLSELEERNYKLDWRRDAINWLVRVLAPYRFKGLLSQDDELPELFPPVIQELLIDAKTGSVRPVIPWDRWGKPDTGKSYPVRIPKRIQREYNLPEIWTPPTAPNFPQPGSSGPVTEP